MVETELQKAK